MLTLKTEEEMCQNLTVAQQTLPNDSAPLLDSGYKGQEKAEKVNLRFERTHPTLPEKAIVKGELTMERLPKIRKVRSEVSPVEPSLTEPQLSEWSKGQEHAIDGLALRKLGLNILRLERQCGNAWKKANASGDAMDIKTHEEACGLLEEELETAFVISKVAELKGLNTKILKWKIDSAEKVLSREVERYVPPKLGNPEVNLPGIGVDMISNHGFVESGEQKSVNMSQLSPVCAPLTMVPDGSSPQVTEGKSEIQQITDEKKDLWNYGANKKLWNGVMKSQSCCTGLLETSGFLEEINGTLDFELLEVAFQAQTEMYRGEDEDGKAEGGIGAEAVQLPVEHEQAEKEGGFESLTNFTVVLEPIGHSVTLSDSESIDPPQEVGSESSEVSCSTMGEREHSIWYTQEQKEKNKNKGKS